MEINIKANEKIILDMEKEYFIVMKEMCMKEILKIIKEEENKFIIVKIFDRYEKPYKNHKK